MKRTLIALWCFFVMVAHWATGSESQPLVIQNTTVIDATGTAAKRDMNVVIRNGRIAEVVPARGAVIPPDARVVNGIGKFLIPGLWDMHVHLSKTGENTLALFVANGVTSVRDMGGDVETLGQWRRQIEDGKRIGPRIKMAGPILETAAKLRQMKRDGGVEPFERFRIGIGRPEDAEQVVAHLSRQGVDFLKIRSVASAETYHAISTAARTRGLSLVGHAVMPPEELIRAGQKSVEHGFFPPLDGRSAEQRRELFRQFATNGIAMVPTFVVGEALLVPYEKMKVITEDAAGNWEPRRKYLSGYLIDDWKEQVEEQKEPYPGLRDYLAKQERDVREMFAAGVRVMPGTDSAVLLIYPGFSLHDELRLLVQRIGMTPLQAIISATRWPAEFFGLQNEMGTIEPGKIADLVLLTANPLEDIANTTHIEAVLRVGTLFTKIDLQALLAETASRAQTDGGPTNVRTK